jgi:hypothetical protein
VASVALEFVLAVVTLLAGAPLVGLVACGAMTISMGVAVVAEIVAFHRIGLAQPDETEIGSSRAAAHRPHQAIW